MTRTDFKKEIAAYRARQGSFDLVTVPPLQYVMIDGHGDPNTSGEYSDALSTLYPVAYGLKFHSKREHDRDYVVMPLEGLWWAPDARVFTVHRDKSLWSWTAMIMTPSWLGPDDLATVRSLVEAKGGAPSLDRLRLETMNEGLAVQTLHVGSYDDEGPVLAALHDDFIPAEGLRMTGKHHEIYLSDARRTAPAKLRTILRQPVERVG